MSARIGLILWCAAALVCAVWVMRPDGVPDTAFMAALALIAGAALCVGGAAGRLRRLVWIETAKLLTNRVFQFGIVTAGLITIIATAVHEPLDGETGWAIAAGSLGAGFWAAEVFLLVLGATSIAGEIGQGTLKMILPHAYKRSEWIAAKALVLIVAALLFAVVVTSVALIHAAVVADLGDVVKEIPAGFGEEEGTVEVFQSASVMRSHLADVVLASLASLVATGLLGLFFSTLFDSVVPALSASFLLFLGLESADVLLGLPRDVLSLIYASYPDQLREWTMKLGRGLNETWDPAFLGEGFALAVLTGAMAWLLAVIRFDHRDLHG